MFPDLLQQLRRRSGWPQLWTSLRILAELLEALGDRREVDGHGESAGSATVVAGPR